METELIAQNNDAFVAAAERRDPRAMAACYAEEGVLLPPGTPAVRGRDDIEAFWRAGIDAGVRGVELETLSLEVWGGAAVEVGRATVTSQGNGAGPVTVVGKYVVLHRRQPDGSWRWAVDIYNSDDGEEPAGGRP